MQLRRLIPRILWDSNGRQTLRVRLVRELGGGGEII